jgi:GPH family glycoside/pentoside/hexuronide:cation symporter
VTAKSAAAGAMLPASVHPGAPARKSGRSGLWTLICYAAPGVPIAMTLYGVGVIVPGFYASTVGLAPAAIGLILLVTRLADVFIDFGAGALSDRTRSRFGRRKPWLILGAAVLAMGFAVQLAPPAHAGMAYFLWGSMAFYLGYSLCVVPYDAWGSELAGDYQARSTLFTYRAAASYIGSIAFCAIPALPIFKTTEFSPEALRFSAFFVAGLLAVTVPLALIVAPKEPAVVKERPNLRQFLSTLRFNKPLRIYAAAAVMNGLSDGLFAAVVFVYQAQYMGFARRFWIILIVYIASNLIALPLWAPVVRRIGKHRAWALGLGLTALCYPPMAFLHPGPASFPPMLALVALAGATYSIANVATPAVLGDVVDYEMLRSRVSAAGSLFAVQALIAKFNVAVGTGLAFLIIGLFGYHGAESLKSPGAVFGLQLSHLYLPSALKFVAIGLIWRFPLDQRVQSIIRRRLDQLATRRAR